MPGISKIHQSIHHARELQAQTFIPSIKAESAEFASFYFCSVDSRKSFRKVFALARGNMAKHQQA